MSIFADCQDVRNMKTIQEIDCPSCGTTKGIEVFLKDGYVVGDSVCDCCSFTIPDGVHLEEFIEKAMENK